MMAKEAFEKLGVKQRKEVEIKRFERNINENSMRIIGK